MRDEIASLFRKGHLLSPPHAAGVDAAVDHLSSVFERIELIGLTIVPLPYAQLARWICLAFLVGIPLNTMSIAWAKALKFESMGPGSGEALDDEGWGEVRIHATVLTLLLSLVANVLYFSIDEVATQLEAPFGRDENDVDVEEPLV